MASARCPDCGGPVDLGVRPSMHQLVSCPGCDADLEVISLDPPEVDWAYASSDDDEE